ncbi:MAG: hypothetical protein R3E36_13710 [Nitrosomonas sp.]|nr:hypothetical protein [Nitrosomonas sp.]
MKLILLLLTFFLSSLACAQENAQKPMPRDNRRSINMKTAKEAPIMAMGMNMPIKATAVTDTAIKRMMIMDTIMGMAGATMDMAINSMKLS